MKKSILILILILNFVFTGCAIKKEDNIAVKTLKHTANSPLYLGYVAKKVTEGAIIGTLYLGAKGVSVATSEEKKATNKANGNSE